MSKTEKEQVQQNDRVDNSRRRLAKAALIGTPLVLMTKSRSVLAMNNACTVSGLDSGNISSGRHDIDPCKTGDYRGLTPGYWGQHPNEWPVGYDVGDCTDGTSGPHCSFNSYGDNGTKFNDAMRGFHGDSVFFEYNSHGLMVPETLMQVIQKEGFADKYQLGAHSAAALLNSIRFNGNFPYSPDEVISLYNTYHSSPSDALMLKQVFETLNQLGG